MKTIIIIICLLITTKMMLAQGIKPDSIVIDIADFSTTTTVSVKCYSYEATFKDDKKVKNIIEAKDIVKINSMLKHSKATKPNPYMDVRGKLTLKYRHQNKEYCFDAGGEFFDSQKRQLSKNLPLLKFLYFLVYDEELK